MNKKQIIKFNPQEIDSWFLINKTNDPLCAFYELVAIEANNQIDLLSGKRADVSSIVVNSGLYEKEVKGRILPKYAKSMKVRKERIQAEVAMMDLMYGPRTSNEVPVDEIWLLDGWLLDNENQ
jgi:hypothetical protein